MLRGLAWPGPGHGLAMAWPWHSHAMAMWRLRRSQWRGHGVPRVPWRMIFGATEDNPWSYCVENQKSWTYGVSFFSIAGLLRKRLDSTCFHFADLRAYCFLFPKYMLFNITTCYGWIRHVSRLLPNWSQLMVGCQTDLKVAPKLCQLEPEVTPKWSQSDPKVIPKWAQNWHKLTQTHPKLTTNWYRTDPKLTPKLILKIPWTSIDNWNQWIDLQGYPWISIGYQWISIYIHWYQWNPLISIDILWYPLISMESLIFMDIHWFHGYPWIAAESRTDYFWDSLPKMPS